MRISSSAVIAGLALAVIVPSTVQASGLANDQALGATPASADGTPDEAAGDPVDAPVPAAAGEPSAEVSQAADSGPDAPTPDTTGSEGNTSEPSVGSPGQQHVLPVGLGRDVHRPHDHVLVEFSIDGAFGPPGHGRHLTVMQSGAAILDSGRPIRRRTWTLSGSRLEQLSSALVQARFWSLLSQYDACHDCSSYSITYAGLTVESRVVVREPWWKPGVTPKRLAPALRLLTHLADTRQAR